MEKTAMVKPVQMGKNTRMTFSKINEVIDMPNLIEIQRILTNGLLPKACKKSLRTWQTLPTLMESWF